ncbi:MAG: hypothetical protein DRP42_02075 [Tenericutes bacterium]|nr:MAG: hypothetical protein DRP42_02075 [Mycoplasmatota bacterium]
MIFAGADGFKPSDFAEVTLVFNNEDKLLPIEYEEVSITRRSFRDQEKNEYYINKAQVRRKDIKNLFLDTGLGNTDLSIISQGSVSNISTAKPDELKGFLNEASGVARYQQQKTEAIRKLEKIDQSLDIFEVKLAELNKQVGPLKKQAEKAVKYLEIKKNLEEVELSLIKEQLKVDIPRQNEIEIDNEKFETDRSSTSQKIERIQEQKTHNNTTQLEIDKKLYELQARQQELSLSMSKSMQGTSSSDNLDKQIKQASSSVNEIRVLQETSKDELEEFKTELTNARDVEFNLRINRDKASATLNQIQYEFKKVSGNKYGSLDKGTRSIIENKDSFYGIVGLVSEIVKIAPEYEIAMNSAIGGKLKNVIVEDEQSVKEAIHFLKKNRLGSATFIPANKVKPKTVRSEYLAILETQPGYEGTLGDLIKTNKKYTNVAQSLGGAILVFDNIDSAMEAAKVVDYRYTIATLEGDIIFPGYTVRGGYAKSYNSQNRTGELQEALTNAQAIYDDNNSQYESHISKIDNLRNRIQLSNNESVRLAERASYIETNITKLISQYETLTGTTYDTESLASSDSGSSASIEQISNAIRKLQQAKTAISEKVIIFDKEEKDLRDI